MTTPHRLATSHMQVRGGHAPWANAFAFEADHSINHDFSCDVLIVGAGISGALIAQEMAGRGLDTVVVDRNLPAAASTSASTAMLLWEIDKPLLKLTSLYGEDKARRVYHASFDAMKGLKDLIMRERISCEFSERQSLYLASASAEPLLAEHQARTRAGLPGRFLNKDQLFKEFGISREGAILSPGSAEADPVKLACGLLTLAISRGARLCDGEVMDYNSNPDGLRIRLKDGRRIQTRNVVIATGYVLPRIVDAFASAPSSSWAIATQPQPDRLWKDNVLIWEDSDDYLYARTTTDGRIIIGGEDSNEIIDPAPRDALIPEKAKKLTEKLAALWPKADLTVTHQWAGKFDTTDDGLPLIGALPNVDGMYAAYGYGGNGITFSYMAAQLLAGAITGQRSKLLDDFYLERVIPSSS